MFLISTSPTEGFFTRIGRTLGICLAIPSALLLSLCTSWAHADTGSETKLVSANTANQAPNDLSATPSVSGNGRYVAFYSKATDLVGDHTCSHCLNVFVRDLQTNSTELISVSTTERPGNESSSNPAISSNGRFVAFDSQADDLVSGDDNNNHDIFVRDRQNGTTERIPLSAPGHPEHRIFEDLRPAISGDGRYVAFSTLAQVVSRDHDNLDDVYIYDRQTDRTQLVSVNPFGIKSNGASYNPSIDSSGRYITFNSHATNLALNDDKGRIDVFVRDLHGGSNGSGTTELVSASGQNRGINGDSTNASISGNGRYIAFDSTSSNLVTDDANGTRQDVFVHDRQTNKNELISASLDGAGANEISYAPSISSGGRYIAFQSRAWNLAPEQTGPTLVVEDEPLENIFLRDYRTGKTSLISINTAGHQGNNMSFEPSISGDGSRVAFSSEANDLVAHDTNKKIDVFVRDTGKEELISFPPFLP